MENEEFKEQKISQKKHGDKFTEESNSGGKVIHKKKDYTDPKGSSGELPYKTDYSKIPVGNTGSNVKQYTNVEKTGSGHEE